MDLGPNFVEISEVAKTLGLPQDRELIINMISARFEDIDFGRESGGFYIRHFGKQGTGLPGEGENLSIEEFRTQIKDAIDFY